MCRIFCIKHPQYDGSTPPELSCETCCKIFLMFLKESEANPLSPGEWLEGKQEQAKKAYLNARGDERPSST